MAAASTPMQLSIVIVSYNVSHFLQQTLVSVQRALAGLTAEVWVVDNASQDNSVAMVRDQFPWVRLIANTDNVGFSKANNQALKLASGQYCLLLNPDVVLGENCLHQCLTYMAQHPEIGGLGVRMIDGAGYYLPESKRGLPTPWVSFCKIMGLSAAFPTSPWLARYYMGHLSENQNQEVEVLSGAFMLIPTAVLNKIGLLDESFFMYGEDVDLSYRITQAGYKNHYLATTTMVHYKGESTKKGSLKYVRVFYQAMAIFARKHFSHQWSLAVVFDLAINLAIWLRASLSVLARVWQRLRLPLLDAAIILVGMYLLKEYWQANHKRVPGAYPPSFMQLTVPAYILAWLGGVWLSGGYLSRPKASAIIRGLLLGMVAISATTNFFDDWRFSKALILLGTGWSIGSMLGWRLLVHFRTQGTLSLEHNRHHRLVVVGTADHAGMVHHIIAEAAVRATILGHLADDGTGLGSLAQLPQVVGQLQANEVIFCGEYMSNEAIIGQMQLPWKGTRPNFRIVPAGSSYIIGSGDKNHPGDFYAPDQRPVWQRPENWQKKRLLDLLLVIPSVLLLPFTSSFSFQDIGQVLQGKATWVLPHDVSISGLRGVLDPGSLGATLPTLQHKINQLYHQEYSPWQDLAWWWRSFKSRS